MEINPIKSGDYEIIDHNTVISFGENPVEFDASAISPNATLKFIFFNDPEVKPEDRMKIEIVENELQIKLWNVNNSLDSGNIDPLEVGVIEGDHKIFLNFRTRKVGNSRTIDYTFYKNV